MATIAAPEDAPAPMQEDADAPPPAAPAPALSKKAKKAALAAASTETAEERAERVAAELMAEEDAKHESQRKAADEVEVRRQQARSSNNNEAASEKDDGRKEESEESEEESEEEEDSDSSVNEDEELPAAMLQAFGRQASVVNKKATSATAGRKAEEAATLGAMPTVHGLVREQVTALVQDKIAKLQAVSPIDDLDVSDITPTGKTGHVRLTVHVRAQAVGSIIGQGGANIRELRDLHPHTKIDIHNSANDTGPRRSLGLSGDCHGVCNLLESIAGLIEGDARRRREWRRQQRREGASSFDNLPGRTDGLPPPREGLPPPAAREGGLPPPLPREGLPPPSSRDVGLPPPPSSVGGLPPPASRPEGLPPPKPSQPPPGLAAPPGLMKPGNPPLIAPPPTLLSKLEGPPAVIATTARPPPDVVAAVGGLPPPPNASASATQFLPPSLGTPSPPSAISTNDTSHMTGEPLGSKQLIDNIALREIMTRSDAVASPHQTPLLPVASPPPAAIVSPLPPALPAPPALATQAPPPVVPLSPPPVLSGGPLSGPNPLTREGSGGGAITAASLLSDTLLAATLSMPMPAGGGARIDPPSLLSPPNPTQTSAATSPRGSGGRRAEQPQLPREANRDSSQSTEGPSQRDAPVGRAPGGRSSRNNRADAAMPHAAAPPAGLVSPAASPGSGSRRSAGRQQRVVGATAPNGGDADEDGAGCAGADDTLGQSRGGGRSAKSVPLGVAPGGPKGRRRGQGATAADQNADGSHSATAPITKRGGAATHLETEQHAASPPAPMPRSPRSPRGAPVFLQQNGLNWAAAEEVEKPAPNQHGEDTANNGMAAARASGRVRRGGGGGGGGNGGAVDKAAEGAALDTAGKGGGNPASRGKGTKGGGKSGGGKAVAGAVAEGGGDSTAHDAAQGGGGGEDSPRGGKGRASGGLAPLGIRSRRARGGRGGGAGGGDGEGGGGGAGGRSSAHHGANAGAGFEGHSNISHC